MTKTQVYSARTSKISEGEEKKTLMDKYRRDTIDYGKYTDLGKRKRKKVLVGTFVSKENIYKRKLVLFMFSSDIFHKY